MFYVKTYHQDFSEEYVEERSLQKLQLQKKRHFLELNGMRKGNSYA